MSIDFFSSILKVILTKTTQDFPTTTIGDSNVNRLIKTFKPTIQQTLMKKYHLKFRLSKFTIIYDTNKLHMGKCTNTIVSFWINVQAYWVHHKSIYFAFKLPNFIL
jgi:hypothetical protein